MIPFAHRARALAVLLLGGLLPILATASPRQAPGQAVTVEVEHFYPLAGSSSNQAGTVGHFGTFHWIGQKSGNQAGTVESTSVAPSVLFSSMNGMIITLSASSVSEGAQTGQTVGSLGTLNLTSPSFVLLDGAGGKFTLSGNQLKVSGKLDFEASPTHTVRIRAVGTEGQVERSFILSVLDETDDDDDGDGLTQSRENELGTDVMLADTDGDGFSDGAEVNAGTNPLDPQSFPAWSAQFLTLRTDGVGENLPAGALAGEFLYADATLPKEVELSIKQGAGHPLFEVVQDAILQTKAVLDFESKPSHEVRVVFEHSSGVRFEKTFSVAVLDSFVPVVLTQEASLGGSSSATLRGEVVDEGDPGGVAEHGIVLSLSPRPAVGKAGSRKLASGSGPGAFLVTVDGLDRGKKYFYRAYARNAEGVAYGSESSFRTSSEDKAPDWANAQPASTPGWWNSPWLGSIYRNQQSAWIMHAQLGWLFPMESPVQGVWLWRSRMGWLWTDAQYYPFLYQNDSGGWLYYYGTKQDRSLFYRYRDARWLVEAKATR
ncbi:hypothetical protein OAK38_04880 [Verrucomicrobia bacterium]|nr:hypothetical protein [Verrucomicrobiota bacterium]